MAVFHIVEKSNLAIAVRTVRNSAAARVLLSHLGEDYEIVQDLCSDIRQKTVDVLSEHAYIKNIELMKRP